MARVRSDRGDPLVVERQFGLGRMVVWTTSCQPLWHDWTSNPSFVVAVLKSQEHMMSGQIDSWQSIVGRSASFSLSRDDYQPSYSVLTPAAGSLIQSEIERTAETVSDSPDEYQIRLGDSADRGIGTETARRGVYEIHTRQTDEQLDVFRWAYNLDTRESELALVDRSTMLDRLSGLRPHYEHWDEVSTDARRDLNSTFARWFLAILIVLLIGEQVLAYLLSYHPARGGVRT